MKGRIRRLWNRAMRWLLWDVIVEIRLNSYVVFGARERLKIEPTAVVNNALFNTISGTITLEEHVFLGHNVVLVTGQHDITKFGLARQKSVPPSGRDIIVRRGAWIASNAVVIGPCDVGENSVIAAGSIVTRDVPSCTVVAGNPAKIIRQIAGSP